MPVLHARKSARFGAALGVVTYLSLRALFFLFPVTDDGLADSSLSRTTSRSSSWFGAETPTLDVAKGHWIPSEKHRFDGSAVDGIKCNANFARYEGIDTESAEGIALSQARSENISAWEYVLEDGTPLTSWDTRAWVENALQSRIGWWIIGDSLTDQFMHALRAVLWPIPRTDASYVFGPHHHTMTTGFGANTGPIPYANVTTYALSKQHPWYRELQLQFPHIPRQRFDQPLLSYYRTFHLISIDEMNDLFASVMNTSSGLDAPRSPRHTSNWQAALVNAANAEGWAKETEGVVVLNTGAHWSWGELEPATGEQVLETYELAMRSVYESVFAVKDLFPLRILFRSTSPVHVGCEEIEGPVAVNDSVALTPAPPSQGRWGWHYFNQFNEIAERIFNDPRGHNKKTGLRAVEYWDIWSMSAQRPDAHRAWFPKYLDCMHWCQPGVPEWWARVLWHKLSER